MKIVSTAICSIFILPITAFALPSSFTIPAGEKLEVDSVSNGTQFNVFLHNESYCCQAWNASPGGDTIPVISTLEFFGGQASNIAERGTDSPSLHGSISAGRECFRFEKTSNSTPGQLRFSVNGLAFAPESLFVSCEETSLFGGFNTVVTDFSFIEVTNTLSHAGENITVRIVGTGNISNQTVIDRQIEIEAGKRVDIDIHSLASEDFGPITITHNGPKGSIKATNAQYKVTSASPLRFEPVLAIDFKER